jgi:large conductance mechanosensitive channel
MGRRYSIVYVGNQGEEVTVWEEFKEFIARGSVVDLAVGVVIGAAFGKIVSSLVNDIIMPPIGMVLGSVDFTNLFVNLSGGAYPSLAAAQEAGAVTINYGAFLNIVIEFLIVAFALFLLIKHVNRLQRPTPEAAPATKQCPRCFTEIPIQATRCPNCTSQLAT